MPDPAPNPAATTAKPAPAEKPPAGGSGSSPAAGADSAAVKPGDKPAEGKPGKAAVPAPATARDHASVAKAAHKLRETRRQVAEQVKLLQEKHTAELGPIKQQLEAFAAKQAEWEADRKAALADPIAWAAKHGGAAPEQAIRGFVNAGTPEATIAAIQKENAELKKGLEELAELRKKDHEAQAKEREEADKRNRANAEAAAVNGFVRSIMADAKKFPYVNALYTPEEVGAKAAEFQRLAMIEEWTDERGQKHVGKAYPFEVVANHFEKFARAAYDKRQARLAELQTPAEGEPAPAAGIQAGGAPGSGRREAKDGPQQKAPPKPRRPQTLTREEEAIADKAMLRKAMEEDAKARAVKH